MFARLNLISKFPLVSEQHLVFICSIIKKKIHIMTGLLNESPPEKGKNYKIIPFKVFIRNIYSLCTL